MTNKVILKRAVSRVLQQYNLLFRPGYHVNGVRVLVYHSIPDELDKGDLLQMSTPKDIFSQQMQFLYDNKYDVVSCDEIVERMNSGQPFERATVAITFDDGFKNNLINAFPVLEKYKFKATIFLATDFIGKSNDWLSWDEIAYLSRTGIFSFGAHSVTHRKLASLDKTELEREIRFPKAVLEQFLKKPIHFFAYPFGSYGSFGEDSIGILRSSGYKAAFTNIIGYNVVDANPYLLKRTRISWIDDRKEFTREIFGAYDWYELWQRLTGTP